jgi:hypothetical protein
VGEDRLTEPSSRIGDDVCRSIPRAVDQLGVSVAGELHALEVLVDHGGEHVLSLAHDDELSRAARLWRVAGSLGEVVEHLGTVGVERLRGEHMLEAERVAEAIERGPNPLQRDAGLRIAASIMPSARPTKGIVAAPTASGGIAATRGAPRTSERSGGLRTYP